MVVAGVYVRAVLDQGVQTRQVVGANGGVEIVADIRCGGRQSGAQYERKDQAPRLRHGINNNVRTERE